MEQYAAAALLILAAIAFTALLLDKAGGSLDELSGQRVTFIQTYAAYFYAPASQEIAQLLGASQTQAPQYGGIVYNIEVTASCDFTVAPSNVYALVYASANNVSTLEAIELRRSPASPDTWTGLSQSLPTPVYVVAQLPTVLCDPAAGGSSFSAIVAVYGDFDALRSGDVKPLALIVSGGTWAKVFSLTSAVYADNP